MHTGTGITKIFMTPKMSQPTQYPAIRCRHVCQQRELCKTVQGLDINKRVKSQELELLRYAYNSYLVFFLNCCSVLIQFINCDSLILTVCYNNAKWYFCLHEEWNLQYVTIDVWSLCSCVQVTLFSCSIWTVTLIVRQLDT